MEKGTLRISGRRYFVGGNGIPFPIILKGRKMENSVPLLCTQEVRETDEEYCPFTI